MTVQNLDEALRALAAGAGDSGILCDFDGSIAEIVDDPERAQPVAGAQEVFARLASTFKIVAVISGRALSSLSARFSAQGVRLLGLYGIEQSIDGTVSVAPEAERARDKVESAHKRLVAAIGHIEGVHFEHKGLAVGIHFRRALDPNKVEEEIESIVRSIAAGERLSVVRGRRMLEIRPRVTIDKGEAARKIIEATGITAAIVAGDDIGDLPMFEAASSLERALRVVIDSDETPSALRNLADVTFEHPSEFVAMLERLAESV